MKRYSYFCKPFLFPTFNDEKQRSRDQRSKYYRISSTSSSKQNSFMKLAFFGHNIRCVCVWCQMNTIHERSHVAYRACAHTHARFHVSSRGRWRWRFRVRQHPGSGDWILPFTLFDLVKIMPWIISCLNVHKHVFQVAPSVSALLRRVSKTVQ